MMTIYPDQKFCWIQATVNMHFNFLLQQGFQVVSVMFTDHGVEDWQVMMLFDDCFVRLRCDSGKVSLGLSKTQFFDQIGFFDLDTLLQFTFDCDHPQDAPEIRQKNEGQQIEEIASLFGKYYGDIFTKFDVLSDLLFDRVWIISKPKSGRLYLDNRPLTL